jgi:DNA polymerase-1
MTPANNILIGVEMRGVWMDRSKLASAYQIALNMRAEIESKIMEHVPDPETTEDWPTEGKRGRKREVNFNPSIFSRWLLFDYLGLPVLNRGKEKQDGSPGDPSMAEDVMLELQQSPGHPVVDLMLERVKWQKYCSAFLSAYEELIDDNDRVHTTFKLYGTVTGRLSSGKAEADKITARAPVRGVNLQQVPRDPFIRGLFGAAPGYTFVEADFSQVELRVVAFLSRDRTMLHLYQTGQDIHRATAAWVLGVPESQVSSDDRKKAKAVNFGFVYGMGANKFVYTAFTKYGVRFTHDEAQAVRKAYFDQFRGLQPWHARQRRLVQENRRVQSPLGRVRHLPDIDSGDFGVRGEAERQAINSPVQSFASDMTMLSMILIQQKFEEKGIDGRFISTVHDALLFEIRDKHVPRALPIIKRTMENLPLERKFGVVLDVPIIADIKVGQYWGDAHELTEEQVYDYRA